jgi:heme A synthase
MHKFAKTRYTQSMRKTMIAPILFAFLTLAAVIGYAAIFLYLPLPMVLKVLIALVVLALVVAMGYVLVQRSRELEEEERDDFGKY